MINLTTAALRYQRYRQRRQERLMAAFTAGWFWTRSERGIYQMQRRGVYDVLGEFSSRRSAEQAILEQHESETT